MVSQIDNDFFRKVFVDVEVISQALLDISGMVKDIKDVLSLYYKNKDKNVSTETSFMPKSEDVERKVLNFFKNHPESIKWYFLCSRKLADNSDQLETALNNLAEKKLIIFEKPSNVRGTWTVKGV